MAAATTATMMMMRICVVGVSLVFVVPVCVAILKCSYGRIISSFWYRILIMINSFVLMFAGVLCEQVFLSE